MRAAIFGGPADITVGDRPDPVIETPTDAIVRVTLACVCGSDLWYYRGVSPHDLGAIGHEFIGVVEAVGAEVRDVAAGDFVVTPFTFSDGTCVHCRPAGRPSASTAAATGTTDATAARARPCGCRSRTRRSSRCPGSGHPTRCCARSWPSRTSICTGHHAAVSAGVGPGMTVAVVGDGAVGLSGVLAAKRLGAERIIALSRNPPARRRPRVRGHRHRRRAR